MSHIHCLHCTIYIFLLYYYYTTAVRPDRMRGGRNKFGPVYRRDRALRRQLMTRQAEMGLIASSQTSESSKNTTPSTTFCTTSVTNVTNAYDVSLNNHDKKAIDNTTLSNNNNNNSIYNICNNINNINIINNYDNYNTLNLLYPLYKQQCFRIKENTTDEETSEAMLQQDIPPDIKPSLDSLQNNLPSNYNNQFLCKETQNINHTNTNTFNNALFSTQKSDNKTTVDLSQNRSSFNEFIFKNENNAMFSDENVNNKSGYTGYLNSDTADFSKSSKSIPNQSFDSLKQLSVGMSPRQLIFDQSFQAKNNHTSFIQNKDASSSEQDKLPLILPINNSSEQKVQLSFPFNPDESQLHQKLLFETPSLQSNESLQLQSGSKEQIEGTYMKIGGSSYDSFQKISDIHAYARSMKLIKELQNNDHRFTESIGKLREFSDNLLIHLEDIIIQLSQHSPKEDVRELCIRYIIQVR